MIMPLACLIFFPVDTDPIIIPDNSWQGGDELISASLVGMFILSGI